jgi:SAM-dependent methyltransferase
LIMPDYSFTRYLSAKKSVDDRALNRPVWGCLAQALPPGTPEQPLRVLEIGAGIGTMVERAVDWGLFQHARYQAIDSQPANIQAARQRLLTWGSAKGMSIREAPQGMSLQGEGQSVDLLLEAVDVFDLLRRENVARQYDLLIAHAFLDLIDIPTLLPRLFDLLAPGGCFYFSVNFDGLTLLEPVIDPDLDEQILSCYHRTMDERVVAGRRSGHSRTGRRLFANLRDAGAEILAAGASDWVVFAGPTGYPADEAYFLHFILYTIHQALADHPDLDPGQLAAWSASRHAQVESGELVYIAHQIDFCGRLPGLYSDPVRAAGG